MTMTILITDETLNINEINFRLAHSEYLVVCSKERVLDPFLYYVQTQKEITVSSNMQTESYWETNDVYE